MTGQKKFLLFAFVTGIVGVVVGGIILAISVLDLFQ
jgi:hypothetical protein